ncbi:ArsI/CadI family heavy metal resistance metalloenzyme [Pontibacter silvestris]|uniref:ArsI/CadI family heavy metal resistance metalloenzyme n=1 Tax=Pontibacter silvestris TaxID=2305183 RepID=A0ABW4X349_9BACT|nr:ArsI/CadI family heavy metal resistance metalloenzyme [Pontibacter silvestris]MCC9135980.1 VOC family protein [Pontibacter silvestris]
MSSTFFPRMHVSLYVANLSKTTNFYTDFFGQEPAKVKPRYVKYVLDKPALIISFVENAERVQQNFGHLGFQVETKQELEERLGIAKEKGLVSKEEIGTACCYAVQDKFWVDDPDGVQWEVYYFYEDAEFNDPHYELTDAITCCMPAEQEKPMVQLSDGEEGASCPPGSGCC